MSERKILSTVTKTLIKNVIRHTDSHNKVVEESDMWRQRDKEHGRGQSGGSSYSFLKDQGLDMRYEFPASRDRRAHMDEEPRSTYWMKELYKAEEADNNRWGHSGYKELYPEHFSRRRSSISEDRDRDIKHTDRHKKNKKVKRKKSRKRRHSDSDNGSDSEIERNGTEKERKKSRKRRHSDSDSASDSEIEREKNGKERERKKRKKKHKNKEKKKRKHKKKKHQEESDS